MHIALFKAHVVDNVDVKLGQEHGKGPSCSSKAPRALEEELLMLSLDF